RLVEGDTWSDASELAPTARYHGSSVTRRPSLGNPPVVLAGRSATRRRHRFAVARIDRPRLGHTAKPDVGRRGVLCLRRPRGRPVAMAILRRAQMRTALERLA